MTTTTNSTNHTRALEVLHENVERIRSSDEWQAALAMRSKLHRYSFNNVLLISIQKPDATMVAGYNKWKEFNRYVKKGEKGIAILAPLIRKVENEDGEKRPVVYGFRTVSVFDVSQTDGEPLPETPRPVLLDGNEEEATRLYDLVAKLAEEEGSPIELVDELRGALGCYELDSKRIKVRSDLPPLQRLKTAVHEVAHALLHARGGDGSTDYDLRELEAESAAYLVANALGLDTGSYSFAYVAHYAGDAEALLASGEAATKAADTILAGLNLES